MTVGPGIGGLIIAGRERFRMDLVMLGVVIPGVVCFALNHAASLPEAACCTRATVDASVARIEGGEIRRLCAGPRAAPRETAAQLDKK